MYKENNLYLLIKAANYVEKQKVVNSIEWRSKRLYLKREKAINLGKKIKRTGDYLAPPIEIVYRCCQMEGLDR